MENLINLCNNFKKSLSSFNPYNYKDGGYNYCKQLEAFLEYVENNGITVNRDLVIVDGHEYEDEGDFYINFKTCEGSQNFYNACKWLQGIDRHWTSCSVEIKLKKNKVYFECESW